MNTIDAIMSRKSVRKYTAQKISDQDLQTLLKAGMCGPSCVNSRPWSFLVIRDKDLLNKMADTNGRPAEPLRKAEVGIMICGDMERAFQPAPDYWIIDCSIAGQNMCLAAHELGIGSVWLGTYPQMERVAEQAKLFDLPETIIPHSIIAFGYPDEAALTKSSADKDKFEGNRVHFDQW